MQNKKFDPYSFLFSLGLLSAFFGVSVWIAFQRVYLNFFPKQIHGGLMFSAFLWPFTAGFLMTAIPKMTRTQPAHFIEVALPFFLVITQWALSLLDKPQLSYALYGIQIFFLISFIGRRFRSRGQTPFEGFVFIPFAFVFGLFGPIYYFLSSSQNLSFFYIFSGQIFVLNLVCGLGSRLIPILTRVPQAINPDVAGVRSRFLEMFLFAAFLNSSFVFEFFRMNQLAYAIRVLFLIIFSIRHLKVFLCPMVRSYVGWGIRVSIFSIILGYLLLAITKGNQLALFHLVFIGGFTLITMMVATRVTLAHGGESLDLELNSKWIVLVVALLFVSMLLRVLAFSDLLGWTLFSSAIVFSLALGTWFFRFYRTLWLIKD